MLSVTFYNNVTPPRWTFVALLRRTNQLRDVSRQISQDIIIVRLYKSINEFYSGKNSIIIFESLLKALKSAWIFSNLHCTDNKTTMLKWHTYSSKIFSMSLIGLFGNKKIVSFDKLSVLKIRIGWSWAFSGIKT